MDATCLMLQKSSTAASSNFFINIEAGEEEATRRTRCTIACAVHAYAHLLDPAQQAADPADAEAAANGALVSMDELAPAASRRTRDLSPPMHEFELALPQDGRPARRGSGGSGIARRSSLTHYAQGSGLVPSVLLRTATPRRGEARRTRACLVDATRIVLAKHAAIFCWGARPGQDVGFVRSAEVAARMAGPFDAVVSPGRPVSGRHSRRRLYEDRHRSPVFVARLDSASELEARVKYLMFLGNSFSACRVREWR